MCVCVVSQIVCDGSGLGAEWFLDYVSVTNSTTGEFAKFVYKGWFDDENGWSHLLLSEGTTVDQVRMSLLGSPT